MAIKSRADLKISFTQGRRPKQQEFWDWQESYYHKTEDTIQLGGSQSRSFLKDLRADGKAPAQGGFSIIDIPLSVTKLKKFSISGKATGAPFIITVGLVYACDKSIAAMNPVPSNGTVFPTNFFLYPILGLGSNPPIPVTINSATPAFSQMVDIAAIRDVTMDFTQARFFQLSITIPLPATFGPNDYVYYGLEFE